MILVMAFEANPFCSMTEISTLLKQYLREEEHLVLELLKTELAIAK